MSYWFFVCLFFIFVFVIFERKRQKDRDRNRDREQERTKLVPTKGHVEKEDREKVSENTFSPGESEREARELQEEPLELNI